jgi:hypothetical protein
MLTVGLRSQVRDFVRPFLVIRGNAAMRSSSRSVGLAVLSLSLGLFGLAGCAEDNEKPVASDSAGKVTAEKRSYGQTAPKATEGNPYGTGYPGAKGAPKAN